MATNLDFEELLSREFRPAEVVCLQPREKFHPRDPAETAKQQKRRSHANETKQQQEQDEEEEKSRQRDFVLRLVAQTPAFRQHLSPEERDKVRQDRDELAMAPPPPVPPAARSTQNPRSDPMAPQFGPLALIDWQSSINWEGVPEEETENTQQESSKKETRTDAELIQQARSILAKPLNPFLENLVLDDTTICWDGLDNAAQWAQKAAEAPLILQMGVAGRSVADKVYLGLSAQRPPPATQEAAYQARMERESHGSSNAIVTAADATKT